MPGEKNGRRWQGRGGKRIEGKEREGEGKILVTEKIRCKSYTIRYISTSSSTLVAAGDL